MPSAFFCRKTGCLRYVCMEVKRKFNYMNLLLILVFVLGLGILLYPNISNFFNERNGSKATADYDEAVAEMNEEHRQALIASANTYNESLLSDKVGRFADMTEEQKQQYMSELNVDGNGMLCYLKIDKLNVNLPVYHGTDESVLQHYVGHVEGTSLPTGGPGTHCGLSGHRGLPSAVLFTNLDRMEIGDTFTIIVLGEEHLYQVDQITTVLPDDLSELEIDPEKDYVTLITCTPYGVNTHRLMVRGVRVPDEEAEEILDSTSGSHSKWYDFTREQIVNIIAGGMVAIFGFVLIPLLIFPPLPKRVVALRPWDDNIEEIISSAIHVTDYSTKANWETARITREAEWLAALRRWDDTLGHKDALSDMDENRPWDDYEYEEGGNQKSSEEEENSREWDQDILEKVTQDWSPFERERYYYLTKFIDIESMMERGTVDPPPEDLQEYFNQELEKEKELLEIAKILAKRK